MSYFFVPAGVATSIVNQMLGKSYDGWPQQPPGATIPIRALLCSPELISHYNTGAGSAIIRTQRQLEGFIRSLPEDSYIRSCLSEAHILTNEVATGTLINLSIPFDREEVEMPPRSGQIVYRNAGYYRYGGSNVRFIRIPCKPSDPNVAEVILNVLPQGAQKLHGSAIFEFALLSMEQRIKGLYDPAPPFPILRSRLLASRPLDDLVGGTLQDLQFVYGGQMIDVKVGEQITIQAGSLLIGSRYEREDTRQPPARSTFTGITGISATKLRQHPQVIGEVVARQALPPSHPQYQTSSELHILFSLFEVGVPAGSIK